MTFAHPLPTCTPVASERAAAWETGDAAAAIMAMDQALLDELHRNRALLGQAIPAGGAVVDGTAFPVLLRTAEHLRSARLDRGLGFAIVRGLDALGLSQAETENVFWRFCVILGEPLAQKTGGVVFGRVADLRLPSATRSRYHETSAGGSVHTDSPIMSRVADLVGLLCLRPATKGGESTFISVARVHDILLRHAPDLLAELYAPFHFDRRIAPALVSPENPAILRAPIFTCDSGFGKRGLRLRWQPEYVWHAPELPGVPPLKERQRLALHLLEGLLEDPAGAITIRLSMRPGDMQFLDNAAVAHGRTPFVDLSLTDDASRLNPATQREMRRVWLARCT